MGAVVLCPEVWAEASAKGSGAAPAAGRGHGDRDGLPDSEPPPCCRGAPQARRLYPTFPDAAGFNTNYTKLPSSHVLLHSLQSNPDCNPLRSDVFLFILFLIPLI